MAEILDSFNFKGGSGSHGAKHPWSLWLDGKIRKLGRDDFGATKLDVMVMMARKAAKKLGKRLRASIDKDAEVIYIQAVDASTPEAEQEQADAPPAPKRRRKTKKQAEQEQADAGAA